MLLKTFTTNRIVITAVKGKQNVVTFKEKASCILLDFQEMKKHLRGQ